MNKMFQWQTTSGNPVTVGAVTVTPQSQALTIRRSFGGLVWNRPSAVLVERDGHVERLPIRDVTRVVQLALLGFSVVFLIVAWITSTRQQEVEQ